MKKQEQEYTFIYNAVEPPIRPVDFEGVHMLLDGTLAFFYNMFANFYSEERAQQELYPFLLAEKNRTVASWRRTTVNSANELN